MIFSGSQSGEKLLNDHRYKITAVLSVLRTLFEVFQALGLDFMLLGSFLCARVFLLNRSV